MLPTDLQRLLDEIDQCERDAAVLVSDLDDGAVNWAEPGKWSVAQCLNHLAVINEFYLRDCGERVEKARRDRVTPFAGLRPTFLGRWFVSSLEPPARFKTKAAKHVEPGPTFTRAELLPALRTSHDGYRVLVHACAQVDVNRVTLPNPFIKAVTMRISTMLLVIPAHDRRHLWQANNVKLALRARRKGAESA
jgi:hypothetical protein